MLGGAESIRAVVRNGLDSDNSKAYAFLDTFHYADTAQLQQLVAWNNEPNAWTDGKRAPVMKENPELVATRFAQ